MSVDHDVVVVGSGASGMLAVDKLLDAGRRVLLLDVGDVDSRYRATIPDRPYEALRRDDPGQHDYMLGTDFEGIDLGKTGPLAQLTPPRQYVFRRAAELLRLGGKGFSATESVARGGLAEAWGAVTFPFTDFELRVAGIEPSDLRSHYEGAARRVGISGDDNDDLVPWRGPLAALQPAHAPDPNAAAVISAYARQRRAVHRRGMRLGRPLLAVLSTELGSRQPNPQFGLDFWSNPGGSVFRPSLLLSELRNRPGLDYRDGMLVARFTETEGAVDVEAYHTASGAIATFRARQLLLAAGTLSTTRIVLRSQNAYDTPVPFVCNEHAYIPSIRVGGLGAAAPQRSHALAQMTAMLDPTGDQEHLVQGQMYSFTGLPLAKLIRESPLGYKSSISIFRTLATSFVILVVQHEDLPGPSKQAVLRRGASPIEDVLEIDYAVTAAEQGQHRAAERAFARMLRAVGCFPIRVVRPGSGSSVHYAGTLPFSTDERRLTTAPTGLLRGCRRVYVGDGAALAYLPAKGPTLTLMANARRIADAVSSGVL